MANSEKRLLSKGEHSNRVFNILELLEEKHQKRLLKYLRSPYFIQSKTLLQLCQAFFILNGKGKKAADREKIWEQAFAPEKYDDVLFRKYCSDLLKHLQIFMAHESLAENPMKLAVERVDFVADHKIEPLYKSTAQEFRTLLEQQIFKSTWYYLNAYRFERQLGTMLQYALKVDQRANLEEISHNLDMLYWIEKLKMASSDISQQSTGNVAYHLEMVNDILATLKKYPIDSIPELAINYYSFMTLYEEDKVEHYYNLKRIIKAFGDQLPNQDAVDIIDAALHYCAGKINKGLQEFNQEYFDLFDEALKKGTYIIKGELTTWRFNNMVAAATKLGKLEWAESFIKNYYKYLPAENRDNTYTFNLARVYRIQGKYQDVLRLLQDVEYEDTGYNLISKAMQLISYYELGEYDALDSHKTAFQTYLKRHKDISKARGMSYLNLIKFTRKLVKLKPNDKAAKEKLKAEITINKPNTVNYEWLMEKLT